MFEQINCLKSYDTVWIDEQLAALREQGLFARIQTIESPMGAHVRIDGHDLLNLSANNYLGLANHPRLREAAKQAIDLYGVGPGAVRTIAGTLRLHVQLEERLARFKGVEAALTFQSGFAANLGTIPVLVGQGDTIFCDELNHASIIDGCRLSGARVVYYRHGEPGDLQQAIRKARLVGKGLIITDGVFSMDGDIAPLPELCEIARQHHFLLMVDDAHGEGVLGRGGRGIVDHFGLHGEVDIEIGTMSKALGVVGGVASGKRAIIDWLSQRARTFRFSSAMTVPDVAACLAALDLLEESMELVGRLWANAQFFIGALKELGFDIGRTQTPIVPVILGDAALTQQFSRRLLEQGVFATAICFPTVPRNTARIRAMVSAAHTTADLKRGIAAFKSVGKELDVI